MAFFDRLYEKKILRPNGAIKGCVPEYVDAMEINSELTKVRPRAAAGRCQTVPLATLRRA